MKKMTLVIEAENADAFLGINFSTKISGCRVATMAIGDVVLDKEKLESKVSDLEDSHERLYERAEKAREILCSDN